MGGAGRLRIPGGDRVPGPRVGRPAGRVRGGPRGPGEEATPLLLGALRQDPTPAVRLAASRALFTLAERDPSLVGPLLASLADDDPMLREEVSARLPRLDRRVVEPAVVQALEVEVARPQPRNPLLSRLFVLLGRVTGRDTGYTPGLPLEEVRALVRKLASVRSPMR